MIQGERVKHLNDAEEPRDGAYVLYWMQRAQRAKMNHALEFAIREANRCGLPLIALFGITQRFPDANARSYAFMLEGLRETKKDLAERGVGLTVRMQPPVEAVRGLASDAVLVVTDRGYLHLERSWRARVAKGIACPLVQVETDAVVPVETVSDKEEYAAYTIRPKIHRHLDGFFRPLEQTSLQRDSVTIAPQGLDLGDIDALLERLRINRSASRVNIYRGGASEANLLLDEFVSRKLGTFADGRNDPTEDHVSHMSPYLHFGQISPLEVALRVNDAEGVGQENRDAYLEELIVRRELSINFCTYNQDYDSIDSLPDWARETLEEHAEDRREFVYDWETFESAKTHDPYWNAAQREMMLTGKMHGYMRMYWGKKILEWTPTPRQAMQGALELNNRYELDGRDPNGFTGVAWCLGKHDRAWAEREIYGKVRYMSAGGLERKFDIQGYVDKVAGLSGSRAGKDAS